MNKPTLLFLHGLGSSSSDWHPQLEFFSKNYHCLAIDLRGHGDAKQDESTSYTIPALASDVIKFLKEKHLDAVHLVGISLGGMVAFEIAANEPQLVKSLTVINALPEFNLKGWKRKAMFYSRLLLIKIFGIEMLGKVLSKKLFPQKRHQDLREKFSEKFAKNNPRIYCKLLISLPGWSVAKQLSKITCPTLFIASKSDYTSFAEKKFFAKKIPHSEIVTIKNAHHAVSAEKPKEFNIALESFLKSAHTSSSPCA